MKPSLLWGILAFGLAATAASAQQISNTLTATPSEELKSWTSNYFDYLNGQTLEEPKGSSINHYLELSRKFHSGWKVGGVGRMDSVWDPVEGQKQVEADHYLKVVAPPIYQNSAGTKVTPQLRYNFGTSKESKEAKQNGIIEPRLYAVGSPTSSLELTYILIPKLHAYQTIQSGQKLGAQGHWLSAAYKLTNIMNLDFGVYPVWSYYRDQETKFNDLPVYPGFTLNFTDNFAVSAYMEVFAAKVERKTTSPGGTISYTFF